MIINNSNHSYNFYDYFKQRFRFAVKHCIFIQKDCLDQDISESNMVHSSTEQKYINNVGSDFTHAQKLWFIGMKLCAFTLVTVSATFLYG